jgi:predicted ATPase with chaperone activity
VSSMLATIRSCSVIGPEGTFVEVEIDLSNGLAAFIIIGLPDNAVNESRERVTANAFPSPNTNVAAKECVIIAFDLLISYRKSAFGMPIKCHCF